MQESIIETHGLTKSYNLGEETLEILKGVSITIKSGEFIAIMGPSGSGKSTLMHLLGLLDNPTSGTLILNGKDTSKLTGDERAKLRNENIGFVFQSFFLLAGTSVLDNVLLPSTYSAKKTGNEREQAIGLLKQLGLGDRLNHKPNQLSGGQQQRVAIARALINNPSIIFADEPTGNLDTKTGNEIMAIFKKLNKEGKTIVMVTHEEDVSKKAKRIIKVKDGKIEK